MAIERRPLRADVGAEILGRIIDGRLRSGTRVNESHLARDLGISRTPLREAMLCLATAGALEADMGRGFSVPHTTEREVVDLVDALALVLPAIVRQACPYGLGDQLEASNSLGRARLETDRPAVFCEHLHRLLELLAKPGRNALLRDECGRLAQLLLRYVHEALVRGWDPEPTISGLQEILSALQKDDGRQAAIGLERTLSLMGADLAARFQAAVAAHD